MSKFDFTSSQKEAEKTYNIGKGEYLKAKEGDNKMRLVSECLPHESVYQGKKTFKWLCQVIDRVDGKVKPYFMPHTIYKAIASLQISDDYKFEEVPMPYDINVVAKGAGTKEVDYTVLPARNNTPLSEDDIKNLASAPTVQELQKKLRDKDSERTVPAHLDSIKEGEKGEIDVDSLPF